MEVVVDLAANFAQRVGFTEANPLDNIAASCFIGFDNSLSKAFPREILRPLPPFTLGVCESPKIDSSLVIL